jgi:hypothetical protein
LGRDARRWQRLSLSLFGKSSSPLSFFFPSSGGFYPPLPSLLSLLSKNLSARAKTLCSLFHPKNIETKNSKLTIHQRGKIIILFNDVAIFTLIILEK